jgi:hypothetical protein
MSPARLIGLAHVCAQWHSGQWSRGYRLLSKIQWRPAGGAEDLLPRWEWEEERRWAAHYTRLARKGLKF